MQIREIISTKWGSIDNFLQEEPQCAPDINEIVSRELNLYRAKLLREKFNQRLKKAGLNQLKNRQQPYSSKTIIRDGYMSIKNAFEPETHRRIQFEILEYLMTKNKDDLKWEYRDQNSTCDEVKGTHFWNLNPVVNNIIREKVRSIIESEIQLNKMEALGVSACMHIHHENDRDSLYHMDNFGAPTVKWFYFPFGCQDGDEGFTYCRNSNIINSYNEEYIRCISPYSQKKGLQKRIDPSDVSEIGKDVITFNQENSLVIADTSGFHARARAKSGTLRVTIQGGLDSRVLAIG